MADPPMSWYEAQPLEPAPSCPPFAGRARVGTAVLGGGLAGLATALGLAERGHEVVLLEADAIGAGASGRNGGIVSAGFARGSLALAARLGEERARALHRLSVEGIERLRARIERHAIRCMPVAGVVAAAWFDDPRERIAEAEALNARFGMRLAVWSGEATRERYRTGRYHGALFDPDGLHLDPLALCRGHARALLAAGGRLHERSPVRALTPAGEGWRLRLDAGEIDADSVVLCTSAYGPPAHPPLARAILPVATYIIVTEPLGERLAEAIREPYAVFDDRFATGYYRPLADGRLLWGGRIGFRAAPRDLAGLMRRDLAEVYPQLAGVGIERAWSGLMGFTRHKMPLLGELAPGLWVNTGYGGHGLNGTTIGGELVARAIAQGDDTWRAFAPFRPLSCHGILGRLAAQALYQSLALRDRLRTPRPAALGNVRV